MRQSEPIVGDHPVEIQYHQFSQSDLMRWAMAVAGVLSWPVTLPLALLSRVSDFVFVTCSQLFALVPYLFGVIMRYEFYRFSLRRCGRNVHVGFGSVLIYRDIEIGDHVLIGMYNTIHHCDIGSYVLTAEGVRLLSGSQYHRHERTDVPMALQGGRLRRIRLGDDCWIGANAVVMNDVGSGAIVGAGAVVTQAVEAGSIVGGVPAKEIGRRNG